jgi:hypothetical protein
MLAVTLPSPAPTSSNSLPLGARPNSRRRCSGPNTNILPRSTSALASVSEYPPTLCSRLDSVSLNVDRRSKACLTNSSVEGSLVCSTKFPGRLRLGSFTKRAVLAAAGPDARAVWCRVEDMSKCTFSGLAL